MEDVIATRNASYQQASRTKNAEEKFLTAADSDMSSAHTKWLAESEKEHKEFLATFDARVKKIRELKTDLQLQDAQEVCRTVALVASSGFLLSCESCGESPPAGDDAAVVVSDGAPVRTAAVSPFANPP